MSIIFTVNDITIEDAGSNLNFRCSETTFNTYLPYLQGCTIFNLTDKGGLFTFNKQNKKCIDLLSQMIGQDITKLYNKMPSAILNTVVNTSINNPILNFSSKHQYPTIIFNRTGPTILEEESFAISDYSENSIVLFTDKKFSEKYADILRIHTTDSPKFNMKLKTSPNGNDTSPGWIYRKSDPNIANIINTLAGTDVFSKITKPPEYKKKFGTFGTKNTEPISNNNNIGLSPFTVNPLMGTIATPQSSIVDPLQNLSSLIDTMSEPLTIVTEKKLTHPTAEMRIGFMGPKNMVDDKVNTYISQYQDYNPTKDLEFEITTNKLVIISRQLTSD
jgi:hypothetical protein